MTNINVRFIKAINSILGITTKISFSSDYILHAGRTEKLLGICQQAGANVYISGPSAKNYFDEVLAKKTGIEVFWMDYTGYREYHQLFPPFEHGVTV